jgi:hypothetical protein
MHIFVWKTLGLHVSKASNLLPFLLRFIAVGIVVKKFEVVVSASLIIRNLKLCYSVFVM